MHQCAGVCRMNFSKCTKRPEYTGESQSCFCCHCLDFFCFQGGVNCCFVLFVFLFTSFHFHFGDWSLVLAFLFFWYFVFVVVVVVALLIATLIFVLIVTNMHVIQISQVGEHEIECQPGFRCEILSIKIVTLCHHLCQKPWEFFKNLYSNLTPTLTIFGLFLSFSFSFSFSFLFFSFLFVLLFLFLFMQFQSNFGQLISI